MAKETYTLTIEKEIIETVDSLREKMIPQLSRSQFVEFALLDKIKKEERKQSQLCKSSIVAGACSFNK